MPIEDKKEKFVFRVEKAKRNAETAKKGGIFCGTR